MAKQTIDPNQLSDIELKAHVYDMNVEIEMINRSMNAINQILAQRAQARAVASQATAKTQQESDLIASPVEAAVLPAE
jgi:hypothetical protein